MIARAFASLPERWQAVLWHTEIEGARPAEVASLLGLTANGVAALAHRAREGLRQAYLQMHMSGAVRDECRPVAAKLGAYVRGGLTSGTRPRWPPTWTSARTAGGSRRTRRRERGPEGHRGAHRARPSRGRLPRLDRGQGRDGRLDRGRLTWFRHAPKGQQAVAAVVAAAAVVGLAAVAMALTGNTSSAPGWWPSRTARCPGGRIRARCNVCSSVGRRKRREVSLALALAAWPGRLALALALALAGAQGRATRLANPLGARLPVARANIGQAWWT